MAYIEWTGGAGSNKRLSGNYRKADNWSSGAVPGQNDDVTLGGSGYSVTLAQADYTLDYVHNITIGNGVQLILKDLTPETRNMSTDFDALGAVANNGSIKLIGGMLTTGNYLDTPDSVIMGWGQASLYGTVSGRIVANGPADHPLQLFGTIHLAGELSGSGTAEIGYLTYEAGARIKVDTMVVDGTLMLDADLTLSRTHLTVDGGSLRPNMHRLTLEGGLLDHATLADYGQSGGSVVNTGLLTVRGGVTIDTELVNTGRIDLSAAPASLTNFISYAATLSGRGTIDLEQGGTLQDYGTILAGQTIRMHGQDVIDFQDLSWDRFHATIKGFDGSDSLHFVDSVAPKGQTRLTYVEDANGGGGTLQLSDGNHVFSTHMVGEYAQDGFHLAYGSDANPYFSVDITYGSQPSSDIASGAVLHL